jgi:hypothetical protein
MSALRSFAGVSMLVVVVMPAGGPIEARGGSIAHHRRLSAFDQGVVDRVKARAAARLDDPECGKLLTDFRDRSGRTLESNLQPLGVSSSRYLLQLSFVDGQALHACRRPTVAMAATPGVPRVFVCPAGTGRDNSRLSRIELEGGSLAEAMVIHEMLHTLGLGENPPSTFEITERVRERCR